MAFAAVGHAKGASTNNNDATTSAFDTTGADLLVAHVSSSAGDGTMSDSKGNTWNIAVGPTAAGRADSVIFWCIPTSVGSGHTFTYSKSGDSPNLSVEAFSGFTSGTVDQTNSATAVSAANLQPGSITPSVDNCLVVSGFGHDNGTVGAVTGYTVTDTDAGAGGLAWGGSMAYQIQTTATATNPTWSTGAGSADSATIVSFKAGTAAATREQEGYRFRADDGSESAATWLASQDTDISRTKDTVTRLRTLIDVTGDAPSEAVTLQYRKVGVGSWRDVPGGI